MTVRTQELAVSQSSVNHNLGSGILLSASTDTQGEKSKRW